MKPLKSSPLQSLTACTQELISKLLESRQLELALQYKMCSLNISLQHHFLASPGSNKPGHLSLDLASSLEANRAVEEVETLMNDILGKVKDMVWLAPFHFSRYVSDAIFAATCRCASRKDWITNWHWGIFYQWREHPIYCKLCWMPLDTTTRNFW